eukprot:544060-Alexandrium_andersonii.AAC.1
MTPGHPRQAPERPKSSVSEACIPKSICQTFESEPGGRSSTAARLWPRVSHCEAPPTDRGARRSRLPGKM